MRAYVRVESFYLATSMLGTDVRDGLTSYVSDKFDMLLISLTTDFVKLKKSHEKKVINIMILSPTPNCHCHKVTNIMSPSKSF